jgi:hypothetical protein
LLVLSTSLYSVLDRSWPIKDAIGDKRRFVGKLKKGGIMRLRAPFERDLGREHGPPQF